MNSNWKPGQSKKSAKAKESADLDDVLGDLLGGDDSLSLDSPKQKKKPAKASVGGKGKSGGREDDFYSSLAADADADYSEISVSEADPNEMAKSMAGFDDMDADLFGSKKATSTPKGRTASPPRRTAPSTPPKGVLRPSTAPESSVKKTVTFSPPQTPPRTAESGESKKSVGAVREDVRAKVDKKKIDFGEMDEDDPLAGLLSDDEEEFGIKKKTPKKSTLRSTPKAEIKPPSPRAEVIEEKKEVPAPAPVKKPAPRRKEAEITFDDDDDDVLGEMLGIDDKDKDVDQPDTSDSDEGLGFDDEAPKGRAKKVDIDLEDNKPAKSIMDSLLGKSTDVSKHLERPGSSSNGAAKREFVLDRKYTKKEEKPKELNEEDFDFGSYRPSSAPSRSSGPGRRGPALDVDDDSDIFGGGSDRPTTRHGLSSTVDPSSGRGHMSATIEAPSRRGMSATVDGSADWLSKALNDSDSDAKPKKDANNKPKKETPKAKADGGDWLGLGEEKGSDEKDPGDWLGFGAEKTEAKPAASDWLGLGAEKEPQTNKRDDWLGLGEEKEVNVSKPKVETPEVKVAVQQEPSVAATLDTGPIIPPYSPPHGPGGSGQTQRRNRLAEMGDLFSTPTVASDMGASLSASAGGRKSGRRRPSTDLKPGGLDFEDGRPLTAEFGETFGLESPIVAAPQPSVLAPDAGVTAQLKEMELQQAALKLKQEQLLRKQQQEQLEMQKRMQEQQLQARQKQREAMELQMRQQQAKLEEESRRLQLMQTSSVGLGSVSYSAPLMSSTMMVTSQVEMEGQVKKLELEKEFLQSMLDTIKKRHQEELEALESSNKSRTQMMEDSFQRREARLREDNDHLVSQNLSKIREMEQERADLILNQHRKLQEWEKDKADELERLKDIHRKVINDQRKEHEETMDRLKTARDHEILAVTNVQSHSKSLQHVMDKIEYQARNLGDLHQRVEGQHGNNLDDRERVMQEKDTNLKVLEERLRRQQEDNDLERSRLQELITKMELQLREQTRQLDAERWKVKQEQNKLESLQIQVDKEKRMLTDQAARDRIEVQKAKDSLLAEQKHIMAQLYEERRALAEERTEFTIQQKLWMEKKEKESMVMIQVEAERDGSMKTLSDERAQITARLAEVTREEERVSLVRNALEREKGDMEEEKRRLQDFAMQLKKRSEEIEEMGLSAARARDEGQEALIVARRSEAEQTSRIQAIQTQLQALRNKEKQMAQERLSLSKDKRDIDNARNTLLCMNCRTPVRDSGPGPNPAAMPSYQSVPHPMAAESRNKGQIISATIELDKNYRLWRIEADRDKDFLEDETAFLEALKHTPYHHRSMTAL